MLISLAIIIGDRPSGFIRPSFKSEAKAEPTRLYGLKSPWASGTVCASYQAGHRLPEAHGPYTRIIRLRQQLAWGSAKAGRASAVQATEHV
jgi:hypothetical protein